MATIIHERPGVYSSYDASAVIRSGRSVRVIGVAAKSVSGTANTPVTLTSYEAGVSAFGEDAEGSPGMSTILRLLFLNSAATVVAVAVDEDDYAAAFAALEAVENVQVVVCDSADQTVQQKLRESVENASALRRERIAVVGMSKATTTELTARATALNSERMVLVAPLGGDAGAAVAAAVAGAIAAESDPAVPLGGAELKGVGALQAQYSDTEIDTLVRGGVTPVESVAGVVSVVRGVTTRTKTGEAADATWRELTTIRIVDDVIPTVRNALKARFRRAKNTEQSRGAIRSQVVVELENKLAREIITGYENVTVTADTENPTVCLVDFAFTVAHGLNQIWLSAHITV